MVLAVSEHTVNNCEVEVLGGLVLMPSACGLQTVASYSVALLGTDVFSEEARVYIWYLEQQDL
jgi:hypothetical protein